MRRFMVSGLLVASLGAAVPARAQNLLEEPRHRQGYYLSMGLAVAIDHTWRDGQSAGTLGGDLFSLRLGQLVTRRFGLGLRIDAGGAAKGPQKTTLAGLGIEAQWELVTNLAVHTALGLGVA